MPPLETGVLELPSGTVCRARSTAIGVKDVVDLVELIHIELAYERLPIVVLEVIVQAFAELYRRLDKESEPRLCPHNIFDCGIFHYAIDAVSDMLCPVQKEHSRVEFVDESSLQFRPGRCSRLAIRNGRSYRGRNMIYMTFVLVTASL